MEQIPSADTHSQSDQATETIRQLKMVSKEVRMIVSESPDI
jgi:hypothetical protein